MAAFEVKRSQHINASPEKVFDFVSDYSTWKSWSPWLCADDKADVTVSDDPGSVGSTYHWAGEVVGEGELQHLNLARPNWINDEIRIAKPFKSKSKVDFEIQPSGDGTEITWTMHGNLPWFLFWMRSMMETFVGMDYERGLKMLSEMIETGKVASKTEVIGIETVEARTVGGVRSQCSMGEINTSMECVFSQAIKGIPNPTGDVLSVYHDVNMKTGQFDYTGGFTVESASEVPADFNTVELPAAKSLHVRHTGSYHHLGNAWSAAYQVARYKKYKIAKRDAFEIYRNDPESTPPEELITDIYLPLR